MSRFPALSTAGDAVPASIFARLREHLAKFPGDVIPLQIGDTHLPPPVHLHEVAWQDMPPSELYAYGSPNGWAPLVDALAAKARDKNGIPATEASVQIACGATHALSAAVQGLCDPGDELILLTPHWPLIRGMAIGFGVVPVEVPWDADLAAAITPRTSAIYFATPNNPDGAMLDPARLRAIAELARATGLWILADEVYEDYGYDSAHASIARRSRPSADGHGVLVREELRAGGAARRLRDRARRRDRGDEEARQPQRVQRAGRDATRGALAALRSGDVWLGEARARYIGRRAIAHAARLHAPAAARRQVARMCGSISRGGPVATACRSSNASRPPACCSRPAAPSARPADAAARLCKFTGVDEARLRRGDRPDQRSACASRR